MKLPTIAAVRAFAATDPVLFALTRLACIAVTGTIIFGALSLLNAPKRAAAAKVAAHAAQVETRVQGTVTQQAVGIVQHGAARDARTQQQHEENSRAFKQLPSGGQTVPDADADAFAQRECLYDSERGGGSCH